MILKKGMRGAQVRQLQRILNAQTGVRSKLPTTGNFLAMTEAVVIAFQKKKGLKPDGIVGPKTWKALKRNPSPVNPIEPSWMGIARKEFGVTEIRKKGQHNPRIVEYLRTCTNLLKWKGAQEKDETAWCSAFVNWCLIKDGKRGTNHALAKSWLNWGFSLSTPLPGAIVVIRKSTGKMDKKTGSSSGFHVGFFVSGTKNSFRLLGGNQGNGWRVQESTYRSASYAVKGHRWPLPVWDAISGDTMMA